MSDSFVPDELQVCARLQDLVNEQEAKGRFKRLSSGDESAPNFDAGTLKEILSRPPGPAARVNGLIPANSSTVVVAQRKAGKTTFLLNLAKSLVTGDEFLDGLGVVPITGSVGFLNYEVNGEKLATWAQEIGVPGDRFFMVNLRGRRNPLNHPEDRPDLAAMLRDQNVETLVVDTFARAFTGTDQNNASEVGSFLSDLDKFARTEVGATDLMLSIHAGWEGNRSRGRRH
jgi:RecA-family ATPase